MRVLIAPDSFKGSIGAAGAAAALAGGWRSARPDDDLLCLPLADGGEGTLEVLAAADTAASWHQSLVTGPDGRTVTGRWLDSHSVAFIELAQASGLPLMAAPDPLLAQTTGTGELIARALDAGARRVVITLGGSASTDGGTGALAALGARFLDGSGRELPAGGGSLWMLAAVDLTGLRHPPPEGAVCLTDVRSPLLGHRGAAATFGPQKGADAAQISVLEAGLARLAQLLGGNPDAAGAGAAGGAAYGFGAAWGAAIAPGAAEVCRVVSLDSELRRSDLVLTGEGRYDASSGEGKITGTVLAAAAAAGTPAALVAGVTDASPPPGVVAAVTLAGLAGGPAAAIASPARWLREAGQALALKLAARPPGAHASPDVSRI